MKLLFVHDRFGSFAGAEANLLATAAELKARGHAVGLAHGPGTGKGEERWTETFPDRFPRPPGGAGPAVCAAFNQFRPDVAYVHKMAELDALRAMLAQGVPLVRMVHDHDLYCMRSYKYNYITRRTCRRAASPYCLFPCGAFVARNPEGGLPLRWVSYRAKREEIRLNQQFERLVVGSRFMREELLRNGFAPAKVEIHPPVPVPGAPSWQSSFSDRNLLVYAGQVVRGKGVDVLLEVLARVHTPFECCIFGDGNHRAYCEQLSRKLGLAGRVHFKGYVPPAELQGCLREASALLLASVWPEPFGAVGLEGMRHGLPVIAFDAGGISEWLIDGFNGWLVPWMDRGAFAGRIEALLRDKALARQMGAHGKTLIAQDYDFSRYIDGLERLFRNVAGLRRQPLAA